MSYRPDNVHLRAWTTQYPLSPIVAPEDNSDSIFTQGEFTRKYVIHQNKMERTLAATYPMDDATIYNPIVLTEAYTPSFLRTACEQEFSRK